MSDTKNMFAEDTPDFYWNTLELADDLVAQGKFEEAEELYKKIAGDQDATGDANAHYGYLLDKLGRYEEAFDCFARVLYGYADTAPREGVVCFIGESMLQEDSYYWHWYDDLDDSVRAYLEYCDSIGKKPDIEKILLNCMESEDLDRTYGPRTKLLHMYGTGKYVFDDGEEVEVEDYPDLEKLKAFVAENYVYDNDVWALIASFCYDSQEVDEISAKALEAALLSARTEEVCTEADDSLFCLYFFGSVFNHYDEALYEIPWLVDTRKAAEFLLKIDYEAVLEDVMDAATSVLEEAHKMAPERADVAFDLLKYVDAYRFAELIRELSDNCARALIVEGYVEQLYELCLDDDEDEYFETYYLALLDFFEKYDTDGKYFDMVKKLLLNAYQFGDDDDDAITLKDEAKAEAFAKKYGMELPFEPF